MLCFLLSAVFILHYHVSAAADDPASHRLHGSNNNNNSPLDDIGGSPVSESVWADLVFFWERVRAGPYALTPYDLVLCAAIVLLGFEFLDFVSKHSGGTDDLCVAVREKKGCLCLACALLYMVNLPFGCRFFCCLLVWFVDAYS